LGPGLPESTYLACLNFKLEKAGLRVQQQLGLPLIYEDIKMNIGYRSDLLVEDIVIVEIKSVASLSDVHAAQVLTYLKLSSAAVGLLINFNVLKLANGGSDTAAHLEHSQRNNNSQGFNPVCFLNAVEKWEMEE
jgi:GxxExxY protein